MTIIPAASTTNGALLKVSISSTVTTISRRSKITPPKRNRKMIEITDLDSTDEEVLAGIRRLGVGTLEIFIDPNGVTDAYLEASFQAGRVEAWTYVMANSTASTYPFNGIIQDYDLSDAIVDGAQKAMITIKGTGNMVPTP